MNVDASLKLWEFEYEFVETTKINLSCSDKFRKEIFNYFRPLKDFEKTKAMGADPATYQYVVQETKKNANLHITVKAGKIK